MRDEHVQRLVNLREELAQLPEVPFPNETWTGIKSWIAKVTPVIRSDWPDFFEDFQAVATKPSGAGVMFLRPDLTMSDQERLRLWRLDNEKSERVRQGILSFLDGLLTLVPKRQEEGALDRALSICRRFPIFAQQLKTRERGRPPIEIQDEYDVQYLLLAILRLDFEDVRKEAWTPSYAGGSSRMDFLLKHEEIVIEAKKTRSALKRDSQIGDQLIVDIERYAQHPDCRILVCFVYDPEMLLDNPKGLEQDLSGLRENIEVIVVVSPSGA